VVDIHPQPEHSQVEVRVGGKPTHVGQIDESALLQGINAAHLTLATAVWDGYFIYEEMKSFELLYHFDTIDACASYLATEWQDAVLDAATISRAQDLLTAGRGELLIREPVRAARLRRS
jgi:hypothetical protein